MKINKIEQEVPEAAPQKKQIKTVVVFCGSRMGNDPDFARHAREVGALLALNGFAVVYGGSASGLMGLVAQSALERGGKVFGIITHAFRNEAFYEPVPGVDEMSVDTLDTRKSLMINMADAAIVLPGGIGTKDERGAVTALMDMQMAARSDDHVKPLIIVNTNGIYDYEMEGMKRLIAADLVHPGRENIYRFVSEPAVAIQKLLTWNDEGILTAREIVDRAAPKPELKP